MGCLGYSKCFELYSVTNDIPEETILENEGCVIIWNEESCLSVGRGRVAGMPAVPRLCVPSFAGTSTRLFDLKMWEWDTEVIICDRACVEREEGMMVKEDE